MIEQTLNLNTGWYIILTCLMTLVLFLCSLSEIMKYHFGKPLAIFFWARVKSWFAPQSIFAVVSMDGTIAFEYGRQEKGGMYRIGEKIETLSWFERKILKKKPKNTLGEGIVPTSVYSINGIQTIPVLDIHPKLHPNITYGLEQLLLQGKNNIVDLEKYCAEDPDTLIFPGMTNTAFLAIYLATAQKYSVAISVDDVRNFTTNNFDENHRLTIEAKESNIRFKQGKDHDYTKWGWYSIFVIVLAFAVKIVWGIL